MTCVQAQRKNLLVVMTAALTINICQILFTNLTVRITSVGTVNNPARMGSDSCLVEPNNSERKAKNQKTEAS